MEYQKNRILIWSEWHHDNNNNNNNNNNNRKLSFFKQKRGTAASDQQQTYDNKKTEAKTDSLWVMGNTVTPRYNERIFSTYILKLSFKSSCYIE